MDIGFFHSGFHVHRSVGIQDVCRLSTESLLLLLSSRAQIAILRPQTLANGNFSIAQLSVVNWTKLLHVIGLSFAAVLLVHLEGIILLNSPLVSESSLLGRHAMWASSAARHQHLAFSPPEELNWFLLLWARCEDRSILPWSFGQQPSLNSCRGDVTDSSQSRR